MRRKLVMMPGRFALLLLMSWSLITTQTACVRLPRRTIAASGQNAPFARRVETRAEPLINLNTATQSELEKLPGIGRALAARILEHREKYGRFRRAEHLLLVRGISERRFRAVSAFLTAE